MKRYTVNEETQQINFLDERFYKVIKDGKELFYPSVTEKLAYYPKGWAYEQWLRDVGRNAEYILQRASESGTKVHNAIADILKGIDIMWDDKIFSEEEWCGILRFDDFRKEFKPVPVASEVKTISHTHKYGGTIDYVCEIDGVRWLIDFKFGNAIYQTYYLQVVAYMQSWNEQNPHLPIEKVGVLHLKSATRGRDKKGLAYQGEGWKLYEPPDSYDKLWRIFLALSEIYDFENPDPQPKSMVYPMVIRGEQCLPQDNIDIITSTS